MADNQNDEGIEFILQHWDLISEPKKKILQLLGISPNKSSYITEYKKTQDTYKTFPHQA
jgi:hypothetical protein